ncbi:MAG: YifB family Mg chelatase-like AAA ATPase [Planctomycetota bacterium]
MIGIAAVPLEIEVGITKRLGGVVIVGLPDKAINESRERVFLALKASGYQLPRGRTTVNLAPADLKKEGPVYDLPIALGILEATEQLVFRNAAKYAVAGELALDGSIRAVRGCLPMALAARDAGFDGLVVPEDNAPEAGIVEGIDVFAVSNLIDAAKFLSGTSALEPVRVHLKSLWEDRPVLPVDFSEVKGHEQAKRTLVIAAAGGHNLIMIGPPGSGKSMLAKRIPTILPELTLDEALEVTKIASVQGLLKKSQTLVTERPFRAPHHTISEPGLVGGGAIPRPGEVTNAHHGVLFLDELPEFNRRTLELLRQPLEDREIVIARAAGATRFPASFMMVAAMNPCPCGYMTHPKRECRCTPPTIEKYRSKISGPLMDRIDLQIEVGAVSYDDLTGKAKAVNSADMRSDVEKVREIMRERFNGRKTRSNAEMTEMEMKEHCEPGSGAKSILREAVDRFALSARAHSRVLKVARTIADLAGSEKLNTEHVAEAIQYRCMDLKES